MSLPGSFRPGDMVGLSRSVVHLINEAADPFAFFVIAADLAPLLDPLPEVRVGDPGILVLPTGAEYRLGEVPGRTEAAGGGVAVYLYPLSSNGSRARFTRVQLFSGPEIRDARGRLVIRRLQA